MAPETGPLGGGGGKFADPTDRARPTPLPGGRVQVYYLPPSLVGKGGGTQTRVLTAQRWDSPSFRQPGPNPSWAWLDRGRNSSWASSGVLYRLPRKKRSSYGFSHVL